MKMWLGIWGYVLAMLAIGVATVDAGWIYDVKGVMAPTLENPVSASFTGELEFPGDLSTEGSLRISLTNEVDPITQEPIVRETQFEMVNNGISPIGIRLFFGVWDNEPFAMQWMDWESTAALDFGAANLENGGNWDAIGIGYHDYQLGSISEVYNRRETPQVNEPGAIVLFLIGGIAAVGYLRKDRVQST